MARVLIACEFSGTVRDAFARRGHDAWSCDLLPTEKPGNHYQCDAREVLGLDWDLMIAHPPCTYLANSGVSWLYKDAARWEKMKAGAEFFKMLMDAPIEQIAIENPIMHKYAVEIIGRRQDQTIQPWMFGHMEKKGTGLWLKNLPLLQPTQNVKEATEALPKNIQQRIHHIPPGADRWKLRSITYSGIAEAMAEQWGNILSIQKRA